MYSYVQYQWGFYDWEHFLQSSRAHECDFDCMIGHMQGLIDSFDYEPEPISVYVENGQGNLVHSWDYYLDDETKEVVLKAHEHLGDINSLHRYHVGNECHGSCCLQEQKLGRRFWTWRSSGSATTIASWPTYHS